MKTQHVIADNIKNFRFIRKIKQSDFAKSCGVSSSAIAKFETRQKTPSIDTLIKIAKALSVHPSELLQEHKLSLEVK